MQELGGGEGGGDKKAPKSCQIKYAQDSPMEKREHHHHDETNFSNNLSKSQKFYIENY